MKGSCRSFDEGDRATCGGFAFSKGSSPASEMRAPVRQTPFQRATSHAQDPTVVPAAPPTKNTTM